MPHTNYILFDPQDYQGLLPLAYTRSVADFRVGIFTIKEKWEFFLDKTVEVQTRTTLQALYDLDINPEGSYVYINASVLPTPELVSEITALPTGDSLIFNGTAIATNSDELFGNLGQLYENLLSTNSNSSNAMPVVLKKCSDLFANNGKEIICDMEHIAIDSGENFNEALATSGSENIYVEESAIIEKAILNASTGPIYIGKHAHIMDGAIIRGPVCIADHAVVKAGAKIYGETTIGPYCKVGGEVSNSILFAYSNKGHDGYVGNSVIGEWCNLGADTNTSNLKNNYGNIECWDYKEKAYQDSGLQFCGLIMGDHSKSGINTMFNTGTVVGVAANIFGSGFPPKFLPSFTWGGVDGLSEFRIDKVFEMAERMMDRRNVEFTKEMKSILQGIFEETATYRIQ